MTRNAAKQNALSNLKALHSKFKLQTTKHLIFRYSFSFKYVMIKCQDTDAFTLKQHTRIANYFVDFSDANIVHDKAYFDYKTQLHNTVQYGFVT